MSLMKMVMVGGFVGTVVLVECLAAYMLIPSAEAVAKATEAPHEEHSHDEKKKDDEHGKDAHGKDAHEEHGEEKHEKTDEHAKPKKPAKKKDSGHGEKKAAGGHGAPAAGGHGAPAAGGHGAPAGGHGGGHGAAAPAGPPHEPDGEYETDLGKYSLMVHKPAADVMLKVNFQLIGVVLGENEEALKELLAKNQHRLRDRIIFEIRNSEVADLTDPGLGLIKRRILAKSNELLGEPLLEEVVFSEFSYNQL